MGILGSIIDLNYGKPLKQEIRSGCGFPVVGSGGIVGHHDQPIVSGPGIVIGRKGTVGNLTYLEDDFFPIDTSYFVSPKVNIGFSFLYFFLNLLGLKSMNSDSAVPGLNRNRALGICVLLPPLNMIQDFEKKVKSSFLKMKNNRKQNQQLSSLRDWLLPMLMNGQVKVGEAAENLSMAAEPEVNYGG